MPTLLHIDASPRPDSNSSALAAKFVATYQQHNPSATVVHHNTSAEKFPYLDMAIIGASGTPADKRTPEHTQALALSDKLTQELLDADVLVIGTPMWNFGIPASLKAWIDLIVRAGLTFAYGPAGPSGLVPQGKKVYIFGSFGGDYTAESPAHAYNFNEPYLRGIFGFLGLHDVTYLTAVNQAATPEMAAAGRKQVEDAIAKIFTT